MINEEYPDWRELACNDPNCEICSYSPEAQFAPLHRWRGNTPPAPVDFKISRINWPMIGALLFVWALVICAAINAVRLW